MRRKADSSRVLQTFYTRGYEPRSSAQASKTGDDTKSSRIPSKDDLVMEAMNKTFLIASASFAFWSCHTKYPIVCCNAGLDVHCFGVYELS